MLVFIVLSHYNAIFCMNFGGTFNKMLLCTYPADIAIAEDWILTVAVAKTISDYVDILSLVYHF